MDNATEDARLRAEAQRELIKLRLLDEGENELHAKIAKCGRPVYLKCATCKDEIELAEQCKRKWCPSCARRSAARTSAELRHIVGHFQWPLFLTLTMRNVSEISSADVKKLRVNFGKFRRRKLWLAHTKAGVATVEITNIGNGWHPHLHAALDCEWLALKTPAPGRRCGHARMEELKASAKRELEAAWAKQLGQETASVYVKRCDAETIGKEVLKYAVKGSDLIESKEPIGDMIRALDAIRCLTTFGNAHGRRVKDIRAEAKAKNDEEREAFKAELPPRCYCGTEEWMPAEIIDRRTEFETYSPENAKFRPHCISV